MKNATRSKPASNTGIENTESLPGEQQQMQSGTTPPAPISSTKKTPARKATKKHAGKKRSQHLLSGPNLQTPGVSRDGIPAPAAGHLSAYCREMERSGYNRSDINRMTSEFIGFALA